MKRWLLFVVLLGMFFCLVVNNFDLKLGDNEFDLVLDFLFKLVVEEVWMEVF